jgi:hypothetical protein
LYLDPPPQVDWQFEEFHGIHENLSTKGFQGNTLKMRLLEAVEDLTAKKCQSYPKGCRSEKSEAFLTVQAEILGSVINSIKT